MSRLARIRRPFVVGVVVERTTAAAARATAAAFRDGADAVELNLASLASHPAPERSFFKGFRRPVYTSCRRAPFMAVYGDAFAKVPVRTEEFRMQWQLECVANGAAGLDIEADTFAPARHEWTHDKGAIRAQAELAANARRSGASVIFSWHPARKLGHAEARRAAWTLRDRGADIVKIVERVGSLPEALDSLAISIELSEELDVPFVFLALGADAVRFRPLMTSFGASYLLARPPIGGNRLPAQPPVRLARAVIDALRGRTS